MTTLAPFGGGYLAQPDMRELVDTALGLGWRLWSYEAWTDPALLSTPEQLLTSEHTNWREREQALNLAVVADRVPRLLVWCGNGHATGAFTTTGCRWGTATWKRPAAARM